MPKCLPVCVTFVLPGLNLNILISFCNDRHRVGWLVYQGPDISVRDIIVPSLRFPSSPVRERGQGREGGHGYRGGRGEVGAGARRRGETRRGDEDWRGRGKVTPWREARFLTNSVRIVEPGK